MSENTRVVGRQVLQDCQRREHIEVGYQTFVSGGGEESGAVRAVAPHGRPELVTYVKNAGDFVVPLDAVEAVHSQKVILYFT